MREGVVKTYNHFNNRIGSMVEVSCDTDFVARNEEFLELVDNLLLHIAFETPENVGDLLFQHYMFDEKKLVCELISEQRKKFGENIEIKKFVRWSLNEE